MAKGTITIDQRFCKGCNLCTLACPYGLVQRSEEFNAAGYRVPRLRDEAGKCTGCTLCAITCPDTAITVYKAAR